MSCSTSKSDQVFTNVGGELRCQGSKMTRSNADQPSAVTLITANAARCRLIALKISPRTIAHRRASSMTNGVASAHGSQETNTSKNGRGQALPAPTACMVKRVWLALNNATTHQMAAIQVQPVERASVRASVITDRLHQGFGEDTGCNEWLFSCNERFQSLPHSPIQ